MDRSTEVAKTILQQLKAGRDSEGTPGTVMMMCWGARGYTAITASTEDRGGLMFRVSGRMHRGMVVIHLTPMDVYKVTIGNFSRKTGKFNKKAELDDVYCDQLTEVVDGMVERQAGAR